jgi:hypothetical protein
MTLMLSQSDVKIFSLLRCAIVGKFTFSRAWKNPWLTDPTPKSRVKYFQPGMTTSLCLLFYCRLTLLYRGIDPPPSDATKLPSVQKSIPVENLPINRLNLLSHLADNTGIYSVPQKLDRGIPTSPSCPAIFKNSLMQMTVPILGDKSSTSSPSSSGVASSTDGGSDEGVVSMIGSGDVADPPVAIYDSDKGVRRKIGNLTSQIPRK